MAVFILFLLDKFRYKKYTVNEQSPTTAEVYRWQFCNGLCPITMYYPTAESASTQNYHTWYTGRYHDVRAKEHPYEKGTDFRGIFKPCHDS